MDVEGVIKIRLRWNGMRITGVDSRSTRPFAAPRVLTGRTADEAIALVSLLFSVCGRAQALCAVAVVEAARGRAADAETILNRELLIACECVQEHLCRLFLDWPPLVGEPPDVAGLAPLRRRIHTVISAATARRGWWNDPLDRTGAAAWAGLAREIADFLETSVFGKSSDAWGTMRGAAEFQRWLDARPTPTARRLAMLRDAPRVRGDTVRLPWLTAADLANRVAPDIERDPAFARAPTWGGEPAETGALARVADRPLLRELDSVFGNGVAIRLIARIQELVELCDRIADLARGDCSQPWLRAASLGDKMACSAVETSRGTLVHRVVLQGNDELASVGRYVIVAPTEWNFHPAGALATGLVGMHALSEEAALRAVQLLVHALDPCVAQEVTVDHA